MWTAKQKTMLKKALADPAVKVAYWCSDAFGGPANHTFDNYGAAWRAYPGRADKLKVNAPEPCSGRALHATALPHRWRGVRVWIVALRNWVDDGDKLAATERTIIGEVTPELCIDPMVGARIGMRDLRNADLRYADLSNADLRYADLRNADLRYADLSNADLSYADLSNADLRYADLSNADLRYADLSYADLSYADLSNADLSYADLRNADLRYADLSYGSCIAPDGSNITRIADLAKWGAIV